MTNLLDGIKPRRDKVKYWLHSLRCQNFMKLSKQYSGYESDFTRFIKDLKQKNPTLEQQQQEGRSLLWDKAPLDLDARERAEQSRVKQQAYVYQNKG